MSKSGLAHLCHHNVHWEFCYDYDERVKYIKKYKPAEEQELRLKFFQIIPDEMLPGRNSAKWDACNKARDTYNKAGDAYIKAEDACNKAWDTYNKAGDACNKAWDACIKAWDTYIKARDACNKAWDAYNKAWDTYSQTHQRELDELHDKLFPDCPWDGKTIFLDKERCK